MGRSLCWEGLRTVVARYAAPALACVLLVAFLPAARGDALQEGVEAYRANRYAQAIQLLRPLAETGNPEAQNHYGLMLANGHGIARNDERAAYWFQRAADAGHTRAQRNLDFLIANGRARASIPEEPECR